jgi:bacteriochlorophyll c synthase
MIVRFLHVALLAVRPWFWCAALGPAYAGYIFNNGDLNDLLQFFTLTVVIGLCIAGLSEVSNEVFDYELDSVGREVKVWGINSSGNTGLIERFRVQPKNLFLAIPVLIVLGLSLAAYFAPSAVGLVVFGMFLGVLYSAPPVRLKINPIGNGVSKFLGYGPVAFLIGTSFSNSALDQSIDATVLGIAFGLIAVGYICIADLADYKIDLQNGIRTIPVVLGQHKSAVLFVVFIVSGHLLLISIALAVSIGSLVSALALLLLSAVLGYQTMHRFQDIQAMSKIHILGGQMMLWGPIITVLSLATK